MDGIGVLIPLVFGLVIGFTAALAFASPRRRSAAAPARARSPEAPRAAPRPAVAVDAEPLRAEVKALKADLAAAQREVAAAKQQNRALAEEHASALARRDKAVADRQAEVEEREHRLEALRQQLARLGASGSAERQVASLAEARDEAERAKAAAQAAEQRAAEREQRLAALQAEMKGVRDELATVRKRNGELSRSVEELTPRFAERNRRIAQLEAELESAQAELSRRPLAAPVTIDPAAAEKRANERLVAAYKLDMARQEDEKAALRREIAQRDARIRELSAGRGAAAKPGRGAAPDLGVDGSLEGRAATAGSSDDLKAIKGIGPVFARLLTDAGYRSFGDLAAADEAAVLAAVTRDGRVPPDVSIWIEEARGRLGARA